jgi:hypothetical protein
MTDRSLLAWERWRDNAEKFDYHMLGVAAALVAYIGQHLTPVRVGLNPASFELLSCLTLTASAVMGILRLRATTSFSLAETVAHDAQEKAGSLKTILLTPRPGPLVDTDSGTVYSREQARELAGVQAAKHASAQREITRWKERSERYYLWRDHTLIAGIICFGWSKLLPFLLLSV